MRKQKIFLTGFGRAGTAWLAQVLNFDNYYNYLFEPFHGQRIKNEALGIYYNGSAPEDQVNNFLQYCVDLYSAKIEVDWIFQYNQQQFSEKSPILVKEISRCYFFLKEHMEKYQDFQYLNLFRHPIPTCLSRMRNGWIPSKESLVDLYENIFPIEFRRNLLYFYKCLDFCNSDLSLCVLYWCLFNDILRFEIIPEYRSIKPLYYENLMREPVKYFHELFNFLDYDNIELIPEDVIKRRSETASPLGESSIDLDDKLGYWIKMISEEDSRICSELLKFSRFDHLYSIDFPLPVNSFKTMDFLL